MANPEKKIALARVTINGGMRSTETPTPLIRPMTSPIASMSKTAPGVAQAEPASQPRSALIMSPPHVEASAIADVAERSIPAVIRTIVWPVATASNGNALEKILARLAGEASPGTIGSMAMNHPTLRTSTAYSE
jgi:hypothetical protein